MWKERREEVKGEEKKRKGEEEMRREEQGDYHKDT